MSLTLSSLLYLGADAVVPKDKKLSMGLAVPCRDTSVELKTASGVLAAAALLALRDAGAVTLVVEQKKGLFGSKARVAVRSGSGDAQPGTVEAGLLGVVGGKDPWVRETVFRWLGSESTNPWGVVVGAVEAELVAAGLLRPGEASGIKAKLGAVAHGRPSVTPDCAAIEGVRTDVDAAVARWQQFAAGEAELAKALVGEARDGIDRRLETD
jgi:hypothetical protein